MQEDCSALRNKFPYKINYSISENVVLYSHMKVDLGSKGMKSRDIIHP